MRILTEASGSLVSGFLIKAIQSAGHEAIASDIEELNHSRYLAEDFILMPKSSDPGLWNFILQKLTEKRIDMVIPSLDESLFGWGERREQLRGQGCEVVVSPVETIRTFRDKWLAFEAFSRLNIPTPRTSLRAEYDYVKPRVGRGSVGHLRRQPGMNMDGMISQEMLSGEEYTVDALFDREGEPLYIVPRKRLKVKDGKSVAGEVVKHEKSEELIRIIARNYPFYGPINFQFFETKDGPQFIEINPRIAGGMALGMAATENWIPLLVEISRGRSLFSPKPTKFGLRMVRYYQECFF